MKRSLVAPAEKPPLSDYSWDHEGRLNWNQEEDKEDVDEYFGDDCLSDKRD